MLREIPATLGGVPASALLATCMLWAGCTAPPPLDDDSSRQAALGGDDPSARAAWLVKSAGANSVAEIELLVASLFSDDAADRMLAITALRQRFGTDLGYDHAATEPVRRVAAALWVQKITRERPIKPAEHGENQPKVPNQAPISVPIEMPTSVPRSPNTTRPTVPIAEINHHPRAVGADMLPCPQNSHLGLADLPLAFCDR